MHNFVEVSGPNLESSKTLGMFTFQSSPNHFCSREGGVECLVEVTVISKEENS
jgi:hypothetical protein